MLTTLAIPEIGLSAATYLGLGLQALRDGNIPRAVECFASIDARPWQAIVIRFPGLPDLLERGVDHDRR
jgi:hypothetical protein